MTDDIDKEIEEETDEEKEEKESDDEKIAEEANFKTSMKSDETMDTSGDKSKIKESDRNETEERNVMKKYEKDEDKIEIEEEKSGKVEDVKTFEEVAAKRLIKSMIGGNPSLTDDTVDQIDVEQCDVVVYDRGKLKGHIRMIHEKGHCDVRQVRARGCEQGQRIRDGWSELKKREEKTRREHVTHVPLGV